MPEITVPPDGPTAGDRRARSRGVATAAIIVSLAGYLVILVAARTLTPADNADFLAYWALLFLGSGVMAGIQSETTRAVHTARSAPGPVPRTTPVLGPALVLGLVVAGLVLLTAPTWHTAVLGDGPRILVVLVAIGAVGFAGHNAVIGALAGQGRWTAFSWLLGGEAVARLVLTLAAAALAVFLPAPVGLPAAAALAALTWAVAAGWPKARVLRGAVTARVPDAPLTLARRMVPAMIGTASSATLLVGFPVMLRLTTEAPQYALAAPLLLAVQVTRAPLMIPLGAFQGVAITHVLDHGAAALARIGAIIVAIGAVGAAAAWAVGPWVMLIFGPEYRVSGAVLAGLTAGAATLALLTLSGAMAIALGRHTLFATGWFLAAAVTVVLLVTVPGSPELRAVLALAAGPLVGVSCHLVPTARAWARRH